MTKEETEEEFELNFLKIDSNNNIKLIEVADYELEWLDLFTSISSFKSESIDGILLKFFKKFIPSTKDIVNTSVELIKKFYNADKKGLEVLESINRILSTNFGNEFIFNKTNIQDVCNILAKKFNDIKKLLSDLEEFQKVIKKINFNQYNIDKNFLSKEYMKKRKISSNYQPGDFKERDLMDTEEDKYLNKYFNKKTGVTYIDNNPRDVINSSKLTKDYNYNQEEASKRILTKECFSFEKFSKDKDDGEIPIEIIILLYKLKDVKSLVYQINNVDEQFFNMTIFLFVNLNWLFMSEIEEIKFDLGNEELQKGINYSFNRRSIELYDYFHETRNNFYFDGSHRARTINCWVPESDILFKESRNAGSNADNSYKLSQQPNKEECFFDNHLCNIYDEYGTLTNFKYIRPIAFTNKYNSNQYEQNEDLNEDFEMNRETINLSNANSFLSKTSSSGNTGIISPSNERNASSQIKSFIQKNIIYFQTVCIYSFFFWNNFKYLKKLSLYFGTSYSYEIQLMFKMFDINYDRFHFLIFTKDIDTLTELNFSFNCLDSSSFENILGIIDNNPNLTSLRMSFFSTEINYFDNNLFNIWSAKKLSLRKLFLEQKELIIANNSDKKRNMNYFLLHHSKFLETLCINLRNLFNLLKTKSLTNLEELALRLDIPLTISNSDKYIVLLVKFIINILIMLSFQVNKIHTLKILAPELPFNSLRMPYIRQLFKELLLEGELSDEEKGKKNSKEKVENKIKKASPAILAKISDLTGKKMSGVLKEHEVNAKANNGDNKIKDDQRQLYRNTSLENITIQLQIYNLPEIFNLFIMNNLEGLKSINLGYLDEITFISFINNYKANKESMACLTSLKIGLADSVISYSNLEKYLLDFININTPAIEEKYLLTNIKVLSEIKMDELVQLVYFKAVVPKLVIQIGNNHDNIYMLRKAIEKYIQDKRTGMYALILLMDRPEYKKLYTMNIIKCLSSYYSKKENRAILCMEDPNPMNN